MVSKSEVTPKASPKVSVILPVFNASPYLEEAVVSILRQTYDNFELIIVDDCSTDGSTKLAEAIAKRDKRIKFLKNKTNQKLSKTLNKAITEASGKYIARMDADDISLPDRLALQVAHMEKHPSVGIIGGSMEIINEKGTVIGQRHYPITDKEIRKKMFWYSPYSHPLIMIRKSVLDRIGLYEHHYNPAEDYDLYFRIGTVSQFANLPQTLLRYRIIPKSMTTGSTKKMEEKTIEIREKYAKSSSYSMGFSESLYNYLHKLSLYVIPSSIKMKAFHAIRSIVQ